MSSNTEAYWVCIVCKALVAKVGKGFQKQFRKHKLLCLDAKVKMLQVKNGKLQS